MRKKKLWKFSSNKKMLTIESMHLRPILQFGLWYKNCKFITVFDKRLIINNVYIVFIQGGKNVLEKNENSHRG
jgi:hypothetical protein